MVREVMNHRASSSSARNGRQRRLFVGVFLCFTPTYRLDEPRVALKLKKDKLKCAGSKFGDAGEPDPNGSDGCAPRQVPVIGTFKHIYDPSEGEIQPYYINDHTIVRGPDGLWHLFGITHTEPAFAEDEKEFAHATSPTLFASTWQKHEPALRADPSFGETYLWAPYVLLYDGTYYMFYCGGGLDATRNQIQLATSPDLWTWTREQEPLFLDGNGARDPYSGDGAK
jgi:hypothetical protein